MCKNDNICEFIVCFLAIVKRRYFLSDRSKYFADREFIAGIYWNAYY